MSIVTPGRNGKHGAPVAAAESRYSSTHLFPYLLFGVIGSDRSSAEGDRSPAEGRYSKCPSAGEVGTLGSSLYAIQAVGPSIESSSSCWTPGEYSQTFPSFKLVSVCCARPTPQVVRRAVCTQLQQVTR